MKLAIIVILVIIASSGYAIAKTFETEYGFVNAWFNGQEAVVRGVTLKIGEPADIKVTVTSNISGNVYVQLTNPLVTEPYNVINGPSMIEEVIPNEGVPVSWSKTYIWTITPNGAWTNGNAPINIFVQFSKQGDKKKIEFTIANPIILDEQYTGAVSTPKPTPQPTEPATGTSPPPKSTPFIPAILAIAILMLAVWLWRRRK